MRKVKISLYVLLILFTLINSASAAQEPFVDKFLGGPLLILVAVIIIDIVAFIYHKVRK